jgi:hypothetical protein
MVVCYAKSPVGRASRHNSLRRHRFPGVELKGRRVKIAEGDEVLMHTLSRGGMYR